jgi:D-arabinono-1,4-lactone oxidase
VGFSGIVELVNATLLHEQQRDWTVKGTRFEIADFFDYRHPDCYRGDSVELFFEVDGLLPSKIGLILNVFKELRGRGLAIGAYVSLRFMAQSRALLGLARWNPTCTVEISMLRGLHGNSEALDRLQEIALNNNGFVHWGQQNDLSQRQVEARFGSALDQWRQVLQDIESTSMLFSTPFTRQHGLEVQLRSPNWTGWQSLNLAGQSSPCVVSAWGDDQPLEIFSQNGSGVVVSLQRPTDRPDADWTPVHNDRVKGRPVALRSKDGRIELFVLFFDQRIKHCWQEGQPGGQWSSWDTLGHGDIGDIDSDPMVVAHNDGRLEVFARGGPSINNPNLFHCWAHWTSGPWSNFISRGSDPIVSSPSACHRIFNSDQLLVVAADGAGRVLVKNQIGLSGDSGWSEWNEILPRGGPSLGASFGGGSPIAIGVTGAGATVHVLAFDNRGQLRETLEEASTLGLLSWGPWQELPLTTGFRLDRASRLTTVQTNRLYLFGMSLQGEILVCEFQPGIGWGNWQNLGGEFTGDVAAGAHADGSIEVVARAKSNQLMARRQVSPGVW